MDITRRGLLQGTAAMVLPVTAVELLGATPEQSFTFAYISDSHIQHIKGTSFVRNWDRGLMRAVAACFDDRLPQTGSRHAKAV